MVGITPMIHRHNTTKGLQQTDKDVHKLLTPDEIISCIARQGNISGWKDTVAATNKRIIIHRIKWRWWGKAVFEDVAWEDVQNATIDGLFSIAHFRLTTTDGRKLLIGNLVKEQARALLTICHERIERKVDTTEEQKGPARQPERDVQSEGPEIERVDEGQDTGRLNQIAKGVHTILVPDETITYIAYQRTGYLDAVVVTNSRIIICRIKWNDPIFEDTTWNDVQRLGPSRGRAQFTFEDVTWDDVQYLVIDELVRVAHFRLATTDGRTLKLNGLAKNQSQTLVALCKDHGVTIDAIEDPENLLGLALRNTQGDSASIREFWGEARAHARFLQEERDRHRQQAEGWQQRAEFAAARGGHSLSLQALRLRTMFREKADFIQARAEIQDRLVFKMKQYLSDLENTRLSLRSLSQKMLNDVDIVREVVRMPGALLESESRIVEKESEISHTQQRLLREESEAKRWEELMLQSRHTGQEDLAAEASTMHENHIKTAHTLKATAAQQRVELGDLKRKAKVLNERLLLAKDRFRKLQHATGSEEPVDMSDFDKLEIDADDLEEAIYDYAPEPAVDLEAMTPGEFEELVARLYGRMGFDVDLTQYSRDGGVDLYARRTNEAGVEEIAVQCKYYSGAVGVAEARALYGVVSAEQRLARGVLVTSGSFSDGCRSFVEGKRLDLIDGARLRELLDRYRVR